MIANTTGVGRFDHIQEKLGQMWNMTELTRSALVSAEAGSFLDEGGVWYPDDRPFLALRGEMPKWLPYCSELLQLIGGGGFMFEELLPRLGSIELTGPALRIQSNFTNALRTMPVRVATA